MKYFLSSIRQEGFDPKNILIVGSHKRAERIIHEFKEHGEYGLRIRSILDPDTSRIGMTVDGMLITGDMYNFKETLKDLEIESHSDEYNWEKYRKCLTTIKNLK